MPSLESNFTKGQAQFIASLSESNTIMRSEVVNGGVAVAYTLDSVISVVEDYSTDSVNRVMIDVDGCHRAWWIGGDGDLLGVQVQTFDPKADDYKWESLPLTSDQLTIIAAGIRGLTE